MDLVCLDSKLKPLNDVSSKFTCDLLFNDDLKYLVVTRLGGFLYTQWFRIDSFMSKEAIIECDKIEFIYQWDDST
ncbi:MAG: hypothetical protein LBC39_02405 [Methanobrevibacter sp.]|jgi:hypothetical protein|nr:hypothetical protein [Candidatus Methanovirga aequatorialis]